mmetsp:Transcript_22926/g.53499  ORF Transcript_22926/g.53499 Transcript_22926/m.53499 type:complete len:378 (-) Transcript_22926:1585-2718(-)
MPAIAARPRAVADGKISTCRASTERRARASPAPTPRCRRGSGERSRERGGELPREVRPMATLCRGDACGDTQWSWKGRTGFGETLRPKVGSSWWSREGRRSATSEGGELEKCGVFSEAGGSLFTSGGSTPVPLSLSFFATPLASPAVSTGVEVQSDACESGALPAVLAAGALGGCGSTLDSPLIQAKALGISPPTAAGATAFWPRKPPARDCKRLFAAGRVMCCVTLAPIVRSSWRSCALCTKSSCVPGKSTRTSSIAVMVSISSSTKSFAKHEAVRAWPSSIATSPKTSPCSSSQTTRSLAQTSTSPPMMKNISLPGTPSYTIVSPGAHRRGTSCWYRPVTIWGSKPLNNRTLLRVSLANNSSSSSLKLEGRMFSI